jgi:hypothetical protein
VHVDDVVRNPSLGGDPLEVVENGSLAPGTREPDEEQVIAGRADLQPKLDRLQSPRLANRAAQRGNFCGGLEGERLRVQATASPTGVQPQLIPDTTHG